MLNLSFVIHFRKEKVTNIVYNRTKQSNQTQVLLIIEIEVIVNVVILTLVIVGIWKDWRNLLVPALIWCIIYPIINFVFVVYSLAYSLVSFHWMTFLVSLFILVFQAYFWIALVSVYDSISPRIKVVVPLPKVKIETCTMLRNFNVLF